MNTRQNDKYKMFNSIKSLCEENRLIWSFDSPFTLSYNSYISKLEELENNFRIQNASTTNITIDKLSKREEMMQKALFISQRLQSYAVVNGNNELLNSVNITHTNLKRAKDIDVISICDTILSKGVAYQSNLRTYSVDMELISGLKSSIAAFESCISRPKSSILNTKTATQNITRLKFQEIHIN